MALDFDPLKDRIETRLAEVIPTRGEPSLAARHSLLAPAKRLRAVLTLLSAQQYGGAIDTALDTACALEMVHTASLIFDDLPAMDDAPLRRGMATPHVVYGEGVAILAGIGLLNGAYELISQCEALTPLQRSEVSLTLSKSIGWQGLVHGQGLDLQSDQNIREANLEDIHYGKTGALFVAAAVAGAQTAHAAPENYSLLTLYGRELGLSYQAFDDVLDEIADDDLAGKTTQKDGGKLTAFTLARGQSCMQAALRRADGHLQAAKDAFLAQGSEDKTFLEGHFPLVVLADYIKAHFSKTFGSITSQP
ncbi:MAG: polyprenyl synthetase family protein [Pseudomonadota bacterium]